MRLRISASSGCTSEKNLAHSVGKGKSSVSTSCDAVPTEFIVSRMLLASKQVNDLFLSPGCQPYVKINGELVPIRVPGIETLSAEDTARIAGDLIGSNQFAVQKLKEVGSCDLSYSVPKLARLRVNVFTQRGTCAIVMRVIATVIPDLASLNLPGEIANIADTKNGMVLVTGPTGSGKSSTLAAIVNLINETKSHHILTIEDPIEFTHKHKKSIVHQRELHSDTPRFDLALRAALRQSPDVILVGEMRDKETIEIALEAAETGHLVLSTLHTIDASSTLDRIIGVFPLSDQQSIRNRFAKSFRYIISQRLLPRKDDSGRVAVVEILKATLRTREYVLKGESQGKSLTDAMHDGSNEGMQHFDGEIQKLIRSGVLDIETGLAFATNSGNLRLEISDLIEQVGNIQDAQPSKGDVLTGTELEIER
ncbi:MAG: PilT/PilU family type 4a pilus ATPase [Acidipila sp.]|nr:PilT/PilU family type 4a pilus ATPase [Acidipila sp.]